MIHVSTGIKFTNAIPVASDHTLTNSWMIDANASLAHRHLRRSFSVLVRYRHSPYPLYQYVELHLRIGGKFVCIAERCSATEESSGMWNERRRMGRRREGGREEGND
ncbi:hypothetical protein VNO80_25215 [Phaseolus coccineus]|uniref:Uncharacterized protein n=1 Tax=Phaseolus coccineus TaxID=3886 RepID=A0AAN9LUC4_PHACN